LKHAGEDWFATEEYARPDDIDNPYTRGEVGREGEYYPPPAPPRKDKYGRTIDDRIFTQRYVDKGKFK